MSSIDADSWCRPSRLSGWVSHRSHIQGRRRIQDFQRRGRSYTQGTRTLGTLGRIRTCRVPHEDGVQAAGAGEGWGGGEGGGVDVGGGEGGPQALVQAWVWA